MKATNISRPIGRYGSIDQLRGLAALGVVAFHAFGSTTGQPLWWPLEPLRSVAMLGWQGVHVFFVVSGYCITEKIDVLASRGQGPEAFLRDRFLRVIPPYWAALALCLAIGFLAAPIKHLPFASALPESSLAAFADYTLLQPVFATPSLLLVSWTLVYEAGYYLISATLFALRPKFGARGHFALATVLAGVCVLAPADRVGGLLACWPEFWLGTFAHAVLRSGRLRLGATTLAAAATIALLAPLGVGSSLHFSAVATSAALIFAHRFDRQLHAAPALRWLGGIGLWSYSLYLVHAPILTRLVNLSLRYVSPGSRAFAVVLVAAVLLTLLLAWIFSCLVERPLESRRRRPRRGSPLAPRTRMASSDALRLAKPDSL